MDPKEVLRNLRRIQKKHKNDSVPTFGVCVSDMARDAGDAIEELQGVIDHLTGGSKSCIYCPDIQYSIGGNK